MHDIKMKLYTAYKNGDTQIILSRRECLIISQDKHDSTTNDHSECISFIHQLDFPFNYKMIDGLMHLCTYRNSLKILMSDDK